jgi:hypothetical protein
MNDFIQLLGLGVTFGFCGALFAGFLGWSISALCRLFIKIIGGR